jgi:hypothetical protein
MVFVVGIISATLFYMRIVDDHIPDNPCVSTIDSGEFIGDDLKPYVFTGTVTFWLKQNKISIFALIKEEGESVVLRRDLLLDTISPISTGVIGTRVKQRYIYPTDTASDKRVLFSAKDEDINLVFHRLRRGVYMVYVNDNWVMTCQEKV